MANSKFKPKEGQEYWTVIKNNTKIWAIRTYWENDDCDYCRFKSDLVFKTKDDAEKLGIPKLQEIMKEYEQ